MSNSYSLKIPFHPGRTNAKANKKLLILLPCNKYPLYTYNILFAVSSFKKWGKYKYRTPVVYKLWSCLLLKDINYLPNILPHIHMCNLFFITPKLCLFVVLSISFCINAKGTDSVLFMAKFLAPKTPGTL